jgi:hypothetical protein
LSISAGNTFLYDLKRDPAHLWVIATDPDEENRFLIVSLTSLKGSKDQTVILHGGDHEFIKWSTCVAYAQSDLMSAERLQELIACGNAKMHADMKPSCTTLILDGFLASDFTKKRIVEFVRQYKAFKPAISPAGAPGT